MRHLTHGLLPALLFLLLAGTQFTTTANAQADPSTTAAYTPPTYHVSILATNTYAAVPNGYSAATGVNSNGEVCGFITPADNYYNTYGFFYHNGVVHWLSPYVNGVEPFAINDSGEIVGTVESTFEAGAWAFSYYRGTMTALGNFPGGTYSECYALNNQGIAAGSANVGEPGSDTQPAIFTSDGPIDLDSSFPDGIVSGINDNGVVVDTEYIEGEAAPFIYENGSVTLIGATPGSSAWGNAINDSGQVVLEDETNSGKMDVLLVEPSGKIDDLGRPVGSTMADPLSINKSGEIVGYYWDANYTSGGFLYSHGHFYDIQDHLDSSGAGISLSEALRTSNSGQITSAGTQGGEQDVLLLTPDDAPGSPTIQSVSPVSAQAVTQIPLLTVHGKGFNEWSTIDWNGTPLATTFVSKTELTAPVPASVNAGLASGTYPGSASLVVVNPGGASAPGSITLTVPTPQLTAISPNNAGKDAPSAALTATGLGFSAGDQVDFGGTLLATTYVSPDELTAVIPESLLTKVGSIKVWVVSPLGAATATKTFSVLSAGISITLGTPGYAPDGDYMFPLTITNNGPATAASFAITGAKLDTLPPTNVGLPDDLGTLAPGQSATTCLDFLSVLPDNTTVTLSVTCKYGATTFTDDFTFVLNIS